LFFKLKKICYTQPIYIIKEKKEKTNREIKDGANYADVIAQDEIKLNKKKSK